MPNGPRTLHDPATLLRRTAAQPARTVALRLREAGHESYFAGGCVRDALLGRPPKDFDVATGAPPDAVERLFPRTAAVGKAFGVVVVVQDGTPVEVATFRADGPYPDGRRPARVEFRSAREDVLRRDFTINGLFLDPADGRLVDFAGGLDDLRHGVVAAIGEPAARFREDSLRMLRAARFASTLGFVLAPETAAAIRELAPLIVRVSAERTGQELLRCLCEAQHTGAAIRLLDTLGLLAVVLPEVAAMRGVRQPPRFHPEGDVFTHTVLMLDALPPPPRDARLTLATLLHDVGKPPTFALAPGPGGEPVIRFMRHAPLGARMTERILRRLKLPCALAADVAAIVGRHMHFAQVRAMRRATLRRFMGAPTFPLELELARLDALHSNGDLSQHAFAAECFAAFREEPVLPPPWVTGDDLLAMGLRPGPALGKLLRSAYDRQLEGREPGRDALLGWIRARLRPTLQECPSTKTCDEA